MEDGKHKKRLKANSILLGRKKYGTTEHFETLCKQCKKPFEVAQYNSARDKGQILNGRIAATILNIVASLTSNTSCFKTQTVVVVLLLFFIDLAGIMNTTLTWMRSVVDI